MRVGLRLLLLLVADLLCSCATATRLLFGAGSTCNALTTSSLQFTGTKLGTAPASSSDGCCDECSQQPGCQMWSLRDSSCELYGLDKGPVTWSIRYQVSAGLMSSGPSSIIESSSECDGNVWLFKGVTFDGVVKATTADPYVLEGGFKNGFPAKTWQECCKGALAAPGTSVMERHYQYRARQYWTWNEADGRCYVKVRPFQIGANVLTMRRAPGVISGMFGNEP